MNHFPFLEDLKRRIKESANDNAEHIQGSIENYMEFSKEGVFILEIKNGAKKWHAAFMMDQYPEEGKPLIGHWVKGWLNTLEDPFEFNGENYRTLFDYKNETAASEMSAFAYFRNQNSKPPQP